MSFVSVDNASLPFRAFTKLLRDELELCSSIDEGVGDALEVGLVRRLRAVKVVNGRKDELRKRPFGRLHAQRFSVGETPVGVEKLSRELHDNVLFQRVCQNNPIYSRHVLVEPSFYPTVTTNEWVMSDDYTLNYLASQTPFYLVGEPQENVKVNA